MIFMLKIKIVKNVLSKIINKCIDVDEVGTKILISKMLVISYPHNQISTISSKNDQLHPFEHS